MGKFDFQIDSEFTKQIERLGNFDSVAEKMLNEAAPILVRYVKAYTFLHQDSGEMHNSIKQTKAGKNKYGWFVTVRPTGSVTRNTSTGTVTVRNMEKMAYLEFGTSQQPPRPVLTAAINSAENEITEKLQEVFNREAGIK